MYELDQIPRQGLIPRGRTLPRLYFAPDVGVLQQRHMRILLVVENLALRIDRWALVHVDRDVPLLAFSFLVEVAEPLMDYGILPGQYRFEGRRDGPWPSSHRVPSLSTPLSGDRLLRARRDRYEMIIR
jgi:hypothetical protein